MSCEACPRLRRYCAEVARSNEILSIIDNTFASPINFRPLEHGADLRHKLEERAQQCPQRGPRHSDNVEPNQPEQADGQRILELRDEPVLQRSTGDAKVFSEIHDD